MAKFIPIDPKDMKDRIIKMAEEEASKPTLDEVLKAICNGCNQIIDYHENPCHYCGSTSATVDDKKIAYQQGREDVINELLGWSECRAEAWRSDSEITYNFIRLGLIPQLKEMKTKRNESK